MKKTIPYFVALLVILGGTAIFLKEELFSHKEVSLDDALIKAEDVSGTDFDVHYQAIYGADYYDMSVSPDISRTTTIHLVGDYKKDETRTMFLTSKVIKYAGNAIPYLEDVNTIANGLGNWLLEEEFVPEFKTSSSYEYRQCIKATGRDEKRLITCVLFQGSSKKTTFSP